MQKPKVSVIIITYRRPHYLQKAIRSVIHQPYSNFELIVVDDASGDNTQEVVQRFADERIFYVVHDTNLGEGGARNTGLRYASGDYVAFLDDDDEWEPEKLKMQVDVLESSPDNVGAVYTGLARVDLGSGEILDVKIPEVEGDIFQDLLHANFIPPSVILIRKKCLDHVGLFDVSIPAGLDHDMWIRIAEKYEIRGIQLPLIKYGMHPHKLCGNFDLQVRGTEMFLKKYRKWFLRNPKCHSWHLKRLAILCFLNGEKRKGISAITSSIKKVPWCIKNYCILLVGVLFGKRMGNVITIQTNIKTFFEKLAMNGRKALEGR